MGTPSHWIVLLQLISSVFAHGYDNSDFDGWYQPVPHRPVDIITDVVNDLGIRILQQYTAHGNVAFSPTGVGFVLAALYEGSAGRGSEQIADALALPRDRDVTRIGFRDIHRRLRTYLNADGFLGGLTLNQENTRLRPEYEDVLRFYGFDLSIMDEETNATTPVPDTTTINQATDQPTIDVETTLATDQTTPPVTPTKISNAQDSTGETEIPTTLPTTTTSPVELLETTLNTANVQDRLTQTTTVASTTILTDFITKLTTLPSASPQTTEGTTTPSSEFPSTFSPSTSTTQTTSKLTDATSVPDATLGSPSTVEESTQTTIVNTTPQNVGSNGDTVTVVPGTTTVPPISTIDMIDSASTVAPDAETLTTTEESVTSATSSSTLASATDATVTEPTPMSTTISSTAGAMEVTRMATETTTIVSTSGASMGLAPINVTRATASSSEVNVLMDVTTSGPPADENTVSTDLSGNQAAPMTSTSEIGSTDLPGTTTMESEVTTVANEPSNTLSSSTAKDDSMNRVRRRSVRSLRGYFSSYPDEGLWMQDLGIWKPYSPSVSEASVRDSTEIPFLVNGCDVSSVSAARYIAVLPFAYFPSLHAVALEFPLDDPRYNILLLMSTDRRDTYRLTRDLGGKSLRLLRNQLQPTWVRATIPSFMLRGFVTLTSFLQRLGILDVFEPRAADLSPMTPDLGIYVRDVQQSIGVNIRNYMQPDRTHSRNGLFERAGPVPFTAVHPFLFFIVDAETSVALIAGRINDPLNSRIL